VADRMMMMTTVSMQNTGYYESRKSNKCIVVRVMIHHNENNLKRIMNYWYYTDKFQWYKIMVLVPMRTASINHAEDKY
jgi:hypothetical protein